ncbi:MAG: 16S rRNA (guanine(966)-N(2))-methyltransferase RsmD [Candidatus Fimimonas sp.]
MRIITGKYKGRTLVAPKSDARPTLDRAKETLFNMLNDKLEGSAVLDLFAGSGQLALECLSRGAQTAYLCDTAKEAHAAIAANFAKVGLHAQLFKCNWAECLSRLANAQVDLAFVDPPYKSGLYVAVLKKLSSCNVVKNGGIVVCEHAAEDDLPTQIADFAQYNQRKVGSVMFTFYCRNASEQTEQ